MIQFLNIKIEKAVPRLEKALELLPCQTADELKKLWANNSPAAQLIKYFCATLPLSDLLLPNIGEILQDYAAHAVFLLGKYKSTAELSPDMFLEYVAHPRVNNERLEACRSTLYSRFSQVVDEKNSVQSVLAVNYTCAQEASYMASDGRTAPALTLMRSAKGRCGEESAFVVHVLRSVGIAARQVYVPRWSHCDDNHAWVEVWCNNAWHYLGACEPEDVLDKGWFNSASARAMLVHSRRFSKPEGGEIITDRFGISWQENALAHYAPTKKLSVTVVDSQNKPVVNAVVEFQVLNYAEFCPIATTFTDDSGIASLVCGHGDVYLHVSFGGKIGEYHAKADETSCIVKLADINTDDSWREVIFSAPPTLPDSSAPISDSAQQQTLARQADANKKRETKIAGFYQENIAQDLLKRSDNPEKLQHALRLSRGNFKEIAAFLADDTMLAGSEDSFNLREELILSLCEKDLYDTSRDLLAEHFVHAVKFKELYPDDIYREAVLSPRIGLEHLSPWRKELAEIFAEHSREEFVNNPEALWQIIDSRINFYEEQEYPTIITLPAECWHGRLGSELSRRILFVAVCRSLGIAAKLREEDQVPVIWQDGIYSPLWASRLQTAGLVLHADNQLWKYSSNWSIARLENGRFTTLRLKQEQWQNEKCTIPLGKGTYRIITTNRLPNGNQFALLRSFCLEDNQQKEITMVLSPVAPDQMLQKIELPAMNLKYKTGEIFDNKHSAMYFWLQPSAEPTEHILNEILQHKQFFAGLAQYVNLILPPMGEKDALAAEIIRSLPKANLLSDADFNTGRKTARSMFLDPDKLPLILLADQNGFGAYGVCGYNVGTAVMLEKLWLILQK